MQRPLHYQAYQQAAVTVSKTRQIVMLYDGMVRFIQQARLAIEHHRIEERYHLLVKASDIVIGLQSCLDFDNGEDVATSLYDYYNSIDSRIMELQRSNSIPDCDTLIEDLKKMRVLWNNIDEAAARMHKADDVTHNAEVLPPTDLSDKGVFVSA